MNVGSGATALGSVISVDLTEKPLNVASLEA
jgi:hypothetical protein